MKKLGDFYHRRFLEREKEIKKRIDPEAEVRVDYSKEGDQYLVEVYHRKTKKFLYRAVYDKIGSYDTFSGVWKWAWATDLIDRRLAKGSEKVRQLADRIEKEYEKYNSKEGDLYHFFSSRGYFSTTHERVPKLIELALEEIDRDWFLAVRLGIDDSTNPKSDAPAVVDYLALKKLIQRA